MLCKRSKKSQNNVMNERIGKLREPQPPRARPCPSSNVTFTAQDKSPVQGLVHQISLRCLDHAGFAVRQLQRRAGRIGQGDPPVGGRRRHHGGGGWSRCHDVDADVDRDNAGNDEALKRLMPALELPPLLRPPALPPLLDGDLAILARVMPA